MSSLARDVRYAGRRLRARPGVAAIIVGSLALGIGANAMIFSLVNGLLLSATPYPDPDRVVLVWFTPPGDPGARTAATHANCAALREWARSFEHIGCVLPASTTNIADVRPGGAAPERLVGQEFTAGAAEALGVVPILGRWFSVEEEQRAEPVMVISHRLWQRRFSGAPDVIGRQMLATSQGLTGGTVTIIGVLPENFALLNGQADAWFPLVAPAAAVTSPARQLLVAGRLRPGVTRAEVRSEMNVIATRLGEALPSTNRGWGIFVERVQETLRSGFGAPLLILQGVVAFVLLIACANIAGLLLAQSAVRRREMAVRSALGSGRWGVVRLLLTESLLLSLLGAAVGLALAQAGLRVLVVSLPPGIPGVESISVDAGVLAFTVVLCLVTGLAFGIAPALHASRRNLADALKDSTRTATTDRRRLRVRSALVIAQIALALPLSIGAGLMLGSLMRLNAIDPGVETAGVMTLQVQLAGRDYLRDTGNRTPSGAPETQIGPRLLLAAERIRVGLAGVPGVLSASAVAATPPLSGFARSYTVEVPGSGTPGQATPVQWFAVLPDYFTTLRAPVVRGRELAAADTSAAPRVAVINRTMAERFWPGGDPIGQEVQIRLSNEPRRQIIGVVADIRQTTRQQDPPHQIYVPFAQLPPVQSGVVAHGLELLTYVVRYSGDPAQLPPALRKVTAHVDPVLPVFNVQPLQEYVSGQLGGFREYAMLLAVFGAVAVSLAVIGIYGIMAQSVAQRTQEIGVHMALGATPRDALWLVLRRGITLTTMGVVVGVVTAMILTDLLRSYLWEVTTTDPLTLSTVAAAVGVVSLLSSYVAARPILRVNPAIALQHGQ